MTPSEGMFVRTTRLTRAGRVVVTLTIVLWAAALATGNRPAAAAALVSTVTIAISLATLRTPTIAATRSLPRDRFTEGDTLEEHLILRLVKGPRTRVHIRERASPGLDPHDHHDPHHGHEVLLSKSHPMELTMRWKAETWGRKTLGPLTATAYDPLRLVEARVTPPGTFVVRVQPAIARLGKFVMKSGAPEPALGIHNVSRPGDGSEFFTLREYQPGDGIRRINWKASARAGNPIVNQVTRDTYARVVILLDMREKEAAGVHTKLPLVYSGRACAALLSHHAGRKDHVNVLGITDQATFLAHSKNPKMDEILRNMTDREPQGALPLDTAMRRQLVAIRPRSPLYFITSGVLDTSLREAVSLAVAIRARPFIILTPAGSTAGHPPEIANAIQQSRAQTLDELRALGAPVVDWDGVRPLEAALLAI